MGSKRCGVGVTGLETTAEGLAQAHRGLQLLRLQAGQLLLRLQQGGLRGQHVQVAADASAIALLGQVESGACGIHRLLLRLRLLRQ
ncbi:hypothetical protein D3C86_1904750 [compost metagenome]